MQSWISIKLPLIKEAYLKKISGKIHLNYLNGYVIIAHHSTTIPGAFVRTSKSMGKLSASEKSSSRENPNQNIFTYLVSNVLKTLAEKVIKAQHAEKK